MLGLTLCQNLIDAVDAALGHLLRGLLGEEGHVGRVVDVDEGAQVLQLEVGIPGVRMMSSSWGTWMMPVSPGKASMNSAPNLPGLHRLGDGIDIHQLAPALSMNTTPSFILAMASRSIMPVVSGSSGVWMVMMSDSRYRVSRSTYSAYARTASFS